MLENENREVVEFKKLISLWKDIYKWKLTAFVAVKTLEGPRLLIGRTVFFCERPIDDAFVAVESPYVSAGREITEVVGGDVSETIDNAAEGILRFSDKKVKLYSSNADNLNISFYPLHHPTISFGPRIPALIVSGSQTYSLVTPPNFRPYEKIDWDLKAANQPFDSFNELLAYMGFPAMQQSRDVSTLEVAGASPVVISADSTIADGFAQVKCLAGEAADTNKIKFGYKVYHGSSIERGHIVGDSFVWDKEGVLKKGSASIPVKEAHLMQGFLGYEDVVLHQWWIGDPKRQLNQRYALYELFDRDLEVLKKFLLTQDGMKDRSFEHGTAQLLTVLGFSVSHYGKSSNMSNGPDIVAFTPEGNVLVVECTTGFLSAKDKLIKLAQRTVAIKDTLAQKGYGRRFIQPVIVTAYSKEEVEAELESAGDKGIAVVCKEDIQELIERVELPVDPENLFKEAQQLIPKIKKKP